MIKIKLEQITEQDLTDLLNNEIPEGRQLDYKRDIPSDTKESRVEFISDISSFANTDGGDIVFGIDEVNGVPAEILGVEVDNVDSLGLRFENICRDNIEPRIGGIQVHGIKLANGRKVIIVRVPQSWQAPHRNRQDRHFYARNSRGKFSMDTAQIRYAFNLNDSLFRRINEFREQRLKLIREGSTPWALARGVRLVLHLAPFASFATSHRLDLNSDIALSNHFTPMNTGQDWQQLLNIDGIITTLKSDHNRGYTQLFRNGVVESVCVFPPADEHVKVVWTSFESLVANAARQYISELRELQFAGPICIMLSLCNTGRSYLDNGGTDRETAVKLVLDEIKVPDIVLDADERLDDLLKEIFGVVWNAYGRKRASDLSFQ